jgi:hypothetical protein
MALTTLANIKTLLGITSTKDDAQLTALQGAAEQILKSYCNQNFEKATYTEFYSGNDRKEIVLRQRPVLSITGVWVDFDGHFGAGTDTPFSSDTKLTAGTDYNLVLDGTWGNSAVSRCGILLRERTVWSQIPRVYVPGKLQPESFQSYGSIKVVYVAGFDPIPQDLQQAVAFLVAYLRRNLKLGGILTSEKLGSYSYALAAPGLDDSVELGTARQIASKYREVAF